jgi:uncharacterized protein YgbK (DUF1537 family)
MEQRWLIVADDLTGAADSAIAFARRRLPARVVWGDARAGDHADAGVLAYDAATREVDAGLAARRHGDVLRRFLHAGMRVFKKIDSTLRGHPAEEVAAMLDVMSSREPATCVVFAPSFPATGRTVREGRVLVHGVPLPFTEFWPLKRDVALADLVHLLETSGLSARNVSLATVRGDRAGLKAALVTLESPRQTTVAVCDAETDGDLERIAEAGLSAGPSMFVGSAGLAHALARQVSRGGGLRSSAHRREPSAQGALLVVGSRAAASRAALAHLATVANLRSVSIEPALLAGDARSPAQAALAHTIGSALTAGIDVAVDIAQITAARGGGDVRLVTSLGRLLAPAARQASALVATGGETAAAMLAQLGVEGIQLLDEIEPGIALGLTLGDVSLPVVTKAGGFGDEACLERIVARLRFIRQTGTVA